MFSRLPNEEDRARFAGKHGLRDRTQEGSGKTGAAVGAQHDHVSPETLGGLADGPGRVAVLRRPAPR